MYFAYIVGRGEGCDYTINCNVTGMLLEVDTKAEAIDKLLKYFNGDEGGSVSTVTSKQKRELLSKYNSVRLMEIKSTEVVTMAKFIDEHMEMMEPPTKMFSEKLTAEEERAAREAIARVRRDRS